MATRIAATVENVLDPLKQLQHDAETYLHQQAEWWEQNRTNESSGEEPMPTRSVGSRIATALENGLDPLRQLQRNAGTHLHQQRGRWEQNSTNGSGEELKATRSMGTRIAAVVGNGLDPLRQLQHDAEAYLHHHRDRWVPNSTNESNGEERMPMLSVGTRIVAAVGNSLDPFRRLHRDTYQQRGILGPN